MALKNILCAGSVLASIAVGPAQEPAILWLLNIYYHSDSSPAVAITSAGAMKWQSRTDNIVDASPAIAADGQVYFAARQGDFAGMTPAGERKWFLWIGGPVVSSPAISPKGDIYILSHHGVAEAIQGTAGLAQTSWPMYRGNLRHAGRVERH